MWNAGCLWDSSYLCRQVSTTATTRKPGNYEVFGEMKPAACEAEEVGAPEVDARKRERREGKEFRARDLDAHCRHWPLSTVCAPTPGKPKAERPCCRLRSPPVPTASQCCRDSRKFCQRMLAGEDISVTVRWLYEDGRCEVAQRRKDRL